MKCRIALVAVLLLFTAPHAQAFLGIGDVSFDPASHAELVKLYVELLHLYRTAREQVDRERQISHLLHEAERTRRLRHPERLERLMARFTQASGLSLSRLSITGVLPPGTGMRLRRRYRQATQGYWQAVGLARATQRALSPLGVQMPGEQKSAAIVARSASLLATFAAERVVRRRRRHLQALVSQGRADRRRRDLVGLYGALGPRSW